MKQKNKRKIVLFASMSVMIFGAPGFAAAGEPAFSEALYANPPPVPNLKQTAAPGTLSPDLVRSGADEKKEIKKDLLPANALMLLPSELHQMQWMPAKMIYPPSLFEPPDLYNPSLASQPLLGFSWDRDAGKLNNWNVAFGLGLYISNYKDWHHPPEDFGLEEPFSDREQRGFFETIINTMQVVGFQIRYDF
ncbi:MAG: hypothetical protein P1P89_01125 [Desulfobacterales bacterium]|nr:hypothetical protein [Desulfobacterales bacterium]